MKRENTNATIGSFQAVDAARGVVISVIIAIVGYFAWLPGPKAAEGQSSISAAGIDMLLVALGLQVAILFGRPVLARLERRHGMEGQISPWAIHVLQLLADGLTVLLFALAVFGGIARFTETA